MNITLTGDLTITICGPFDGKLATLAEPTRLAPPPCAPVVPMPGESARVVMGRYVAVLRTHERWTQAELGEMLGMKPMTVSRLESGQRPISIDELSSNRQDVRPHMRRTHLSDRHRRGASE